MALNGADILIYPTAIGGVATDAPSEQELQRGAWQIVQRGHAVANGLPVITVNRTGFRERPVREHPGTGFLGSSFVAWTSGRDSQPQFEPR